MKKLMSIMLALAMALSLCVTTTWAAENVAKTDTTEYATLKDAVEAATDGATITLIGNATLTEMLTLGKTLTIDLNGFKLEQLGNGKTDNDAIEAGGSLVQIVNNATLTIIGTTPGSQVYGRINVGKAEDNNGNAKLNGGTYTCEDGNTVLHVNGTCLNSDVTIKNATITTKDNGIQLSGKGTFLIENSTITGYTAVYVKSGALTIKDSTLIGNMDPVNYSYNGNGSNATGDALVVDSCEYPGGAPTITIENSTLKGAKAAVGAYEYVKTSGHTQANVVVTSGSLIGGKQPGITTNKSGATGVSISDVDYTNITFPTGTPVATNGDDYYVGSDSIAAAANSGKEMTMVQGGAIDGLEPGATIIVPQGVSGTTLNGNAAEYGYYTIADPNAYQHEPIRRQHTTTTVEDTTTTTPAAKADDTTKADTVTSAKTFDAGVAVYGMMAVLSLTGSAWVVGKKRV